MLEGAVIGLSLVFIGGKIACSIHEWKDRKRYAKELKKYNQDFKSWRSAELAWFYEVHKRNYYYDARADLMTPSKKSFHRVLYSVEDFNRQFNIADVPPRPTPPEQPVRYIGIFMVPTRNY